MKPATRRVQVDDMRDLLEAAPRANVAYRVGDDIEAASVAFRFHAGRDRFGLPRTGASPLPGPGDVVKLLVDDGRWFFELRGLWVRGRAVPENEPPDDNSGSVAGSLAWFELIPEKTVAWHYGTLREARDDSR